MRTGVAVVENVDDKVLAKARGKAPRWYRKVGLGFATPQTAIKGVYVDKKCPFTGDVSIRGRILKGIVVSTKMTRTIVLRRDYLRYVSKYRRYEKRHKTVPAHCSPAFLVKDGDVVTVDAVAGVLSFEISDQELALRAAAWTRPERKISGALAKYAALVGPASKGAVTG